MANGERQDVKRQHFVPRAYLKRFSADGRSIWAFDKVTKKAFNPNLMGIAQAHLFYDLPAAAFEGLPPEQHDPQVAEKDPGVMEGKLPTVFTEFVDEVNTGKLSNRVRQRMALITAIQWLRTPQFRETLFEMQQKTMQAVADVICRANFPDLDPAQYPRVVCGRANLPAVHYQELFNEDLVVRLGVALTRHIWVLGENTTAQPLYTSDHPVVKLVPGGPAGEGSTGILSPGVEIAYPLSSNHVLLMFERTVHASLLPFHGRAVPLSEQQVEHCNHLQVRRCHRQVYCAGDEFAQARDACARFPEACATDRQRTDVVTVGNKVLLNIRE